MLTKYMPQMV